MKIITIDNTRKAGNFFDNINNNEYLMYRYFIDENTNSLLNFINLQDKYHYINNETINQYKNKIYEFIFDKYAFKMFLLNKYQLQQIHNFYKEHNKCVRNENGENIYGALGGGFELVYQINYNYEDLIPYCQFKYVECIKCKTKNKCIDNIDKIDIKKINYPKFNKVEFYRFMEIYNEYKQPLEIRIMPMGFGNTYTIYVEDFEYDITNVDSW